MKEFFLSYKRRVLCPPDVPQTRPTRAQTILFARFNQIEGMRDL